MGNVKDGKGTLIGNAGEYFLVAELLRRGIIAALAPRNAPMFDILATDTVNTIRLRVKTKSGQYDSWQWVIKKDGKIFRGISETDFCVLIDLKDINFAPDFYFFKTQEVEDLLKEDFEDWVKEPPKRNKPHDPQNTHRALRKSKYATLLASRMNWDFLGLKYMQNK